MRYRLNVLFALAGVPIVCALLFVQTAVSAERIGVSAPIDRAEKITESLVGATRRGRHSVGGLISESGGAIGATSTVSRHSSLFGGSKFGRSGYLLLGQIDSQFRIWLEIALKHTPALVMGLFIVLIVPPLAAAGWLVRLMQPHGNSTYRVLMPAFEVENSLHVREEFDGHADFSRDAVVEIVVGTTSNFAGSFEFDRHALVARVGREDDNEIQIRDHTVHRYHAAIDRSADSGITISDLSGKRGNGVILNGRRVMHAELRDGDTIGLGAVNLVFRLKAR